MGKRYYEISDVVNFQPTSIDGNVKRLFEAKDSESETGYSLTVRINATHSGLITGNFGIYLPKHMKDGLKTFTKPYNKPWLLNHNEDSDPVGRVLKADYVSLADNYPRIQDKILRLESSVPREEEVKLIQSMLRTLESPKHQGFGFASLMVNITDKETIEKVLNGTYLTVSTRQRSENATCSICGADWLFGEYCNHFPGEYDKEAKQRGYVITGPLFYKEGSFVNVPADEYATVAEIYEDGELKDSFEIRPDRKFIVPVDIFLQGADNFVNVRNNFDIFAHAEIVDQLASLARDKKEIQISNQPKENEAKDNKGGNQVMTLKELMSDHDVLIAEVEKIVAEAKDTLAYKRIAKLPDSDFFGPQRTFPRVSKEITEAYISILEKCDNDNDAKTLLAEIKNETSVGDLEKALDDLKADKLAELVAKVLAKAHTDKDLMQKALSSLPAFTDLETEVQAVKKQLSTAEIDLQNAVTNIASLTTELKDAYSNLLMVHSAIIEDITDKQEFMDGIKEETIVALKEKLQPVLDEFNPQMLRDKLNSQQVNDPSVKEAESKKLREKTDAEISKTYFELLDKDVDKAYQYLNTQIRIGRVPKDFNPQRTKN